MEVSEKDKIDLNTPAYGEGSEVKTTTKSAEEVVKEEKPADESAEEPERVKYSRFKQVYEKAKQYEDESEKYRKEAEEWKQKAETYKPREENDVELPSHWVKLYGDSDASKEAWQIQREQNEAIKAEARQEALEAVRNERYVEKERIDKNMGVLDNELETLQDYVGRPLTEKEESAILDIVDEFTPKDEDGNYAGSMIPFDKAWEIYELKQGSSNSQKRGSRDNVASLSGNQSQGSADAQAEKDKNFNPLEWGAWRKHI